MRTLRDKKLNQSQRALASLADQGCRADKLFKAMNFTRFQVSEQETTCLAFVSHSMFGLLQKYQTYPFFGTKLSSRKCAVAIFLIKIMSDLVSSRLLIEIYVTNIQDIQTQSCALNVHRLFQTKMSAHKGYVQLVQATE